MASPTSSIPQPNREIIGNNPAALNQALSDVAAAAIVDINGLLAASKFVARGVCTTNMSIAAFVGVSGGTPQDGLTYAAGDRVLLVGQSTPAQNGIYVVGTVAAGTAPLTRVTDMATGLSLPLAASVDVIEGTIWNNSSWKATVTASPVVGTTDPKFFPRVHKGHGALVSGTPSVLTVSTLFSLATAELSVEQQTTQANNIKATFTAGQGNGVLTITGPNTVTDQVSWMIVNF